MATAEAVAGIPAKPPAIPAAAAAVECAAR